jgi:hypothetical protein
MKILMSIAVALCSAIVIGMLVGQSSAGAAQSHTPRSKQSKTISATYHYGAQSKTIKASYKFGPMSAVKNTRPALKLPCGPKLNAHDRTQLCWDGTLTFTFQTDKEPVGVLTAELVQYISGSP